MRGRAGLLGCELRGGGYRAGVLKSVGRRLDCVGLAPFRVGWGGHLLVDEVERGRRQSAEFAGFQVVWDSGDRFFGARRPAEVRLSARRSGRGPCGAIQLFFSKQSFHPHRVNHRLELSPLTQSSQHVNRLGRAHVPYRAPRLGSAPSHCRVLFGPLGQPAGPRAVHLPAQALELSSS